MQLRNNPSSFESWHPFDRGPLPDVVEDSTDSAWNEYDACVAALQEQVEQLRGALRRMPRAAHARLRDIEFRFSAELARRSDIDEVLAIARQNGRICPQPAPWRALYLLLPIVESNGSLKRAPYPMGIVEWQDATDLQKQLRLVEQLNWAQANGGLARVSAFLAGLREAEWHHSIPVDWPKIAS